MRYFLISTFLLLLTGCSSSTPVADMDRRILQVYASAAAEPWLEDVYNCAERSPELLVSRTFDIASANLILRVGAFPGLEGVPYQITETEIVILLNADNPLLELGVDDVRAIFTGKIRNWAEVGGEDAEIQVWGYPAEDDLQQAFNETVLGGGSLLSLAKQAQSPRAMRDAILADRSAIGISLRDHYSAEDGVFSFEMEEKITLPVLIFSLDVDSPDAKKIVACLQE